VEDRPSMIRSRTVTGWLGALLLGSTALVVVIPAPLRVLPAPAEVAEVVSPALRVPLPAVLRVPMPAPRWLQMPAG
jgi:hypothetical protein